MNKVELMVKNTSLGGFKKLTIEGPFNEDSYRIITEDFSKDHIKESLSLTPGEWMIIAKIIEALKI